MILIRELQTMEEFEAAGDVEQAVWGVDQRDALPAAFMRANYAAGGVTLGAYQDGRMLGMCSAFPAMRDGIPFLWSHVTGVLPEAQRLNIGYQLKQKQADWAEANGFQEIHWTYDPLQAGNAHFNLRRLGATTNRYYLNFYGVMRDSINAGVESDRVEATWAVTERSSRAPVAPAPPPHLFERALALVSTNGLPDVRLDDLRGSLLLAELPPSLKALAPEARHDWRLALRKVLMALFAEGFTATDVLRRVEDHYYVLQRSSGSL